MSRALRDPILAPISVVIPVYNQAAYVAQAIGSVLAQTHPAADIIVVDDGSTDETSAVIAGFGSALTRIRQDNRGLSSARNRGIQACAGDVVAFLDSDDVWHPDHLAELRSLMSLRPDAVAWHTCARCMDERGLLLPQRAGSTPGGRTEISLGSLLKANHILPSTAAVRRQSLLDVGLFDEDEGIRAGFEDWDLWLRLSQRGTIVGGTRETISYRVHGQSMSAGIAGMQAAAMAVARRQLGPEDGNPAAWPADKRIGWAGAYRTCALIALVRAGDWEGCVGWLGRALRTEPAMAGDADLFYELALGRQPLGFRGSTERADLDDAETRIAAMLDRLPKDSAQTAARTAWLALSKVAYNLNRPALARAALARLLRDDFRAAFTPAVLALMARSTILQPLIRRRRALRHKNA